MRTAAHIRVGTPTLSKVEDRVIWSVPINHPQLPDQLWYSVPSKFADLLSLRADAALVALTLPALHLAADIHTQAPVTDELLHNHKDLQSIYLMAGQGVHPISALPSEVLPGTRAAGVATGFSAGVDSFAVMAENFYDGSIPDSQRLTHLLFNNVGSHYIWHPQNAPDGRVAMDSQRQLWHARFRQVQSVAERIGLPLIDVDSNIVQMFPAPFSKFEHSHTLRNGSVAHLLSEGLGTWIYASAYHYKDLDVAKKSCGYSDPFSVPFLSSSRISARLSGARLRRVDKTALIAEILDAQAHLDVCTKGTDGSNCARCGKCRRTLATLEILGRLGDFRERFDLEKWQADRVAYYSQVLARHRTDEFQGELVALANEKNFHFPADSYAGAAKLRLRYALSPLEKILKALGRQTFKALDRRDAKRPSQS